MLCWWPVTKNCIVWWKRASMSVQGCYFHLWSTSLSKIHQKVPLSWWSSACKSRGSYSPFLNGILKINNQHSHQTKLWNVLLKVSLEIPLTLLKAEPFFFFFLVFCTPSLSHLNLLLLPILELLGNGLHCTLNYASFWDLEEVLFILYMCL